MLCEQSYTTQMYQSNAFLRSKMWKCWIKVNNELQRERVAFYIMWGRWGSKLRPQPHFFLPSPPIPPCCGTVRPVFPSKVKWKKLHHKTAKLPLCRILQLTTRDGPDIKLARYYPATGYPAKVDTNFTFCSKTGYLKDWIYGTSLLRTLAVNERCK